MNLYSLYKKIKKEKIPDTEYFGDKARLYDIQRIYEKKWNTENTIVEDFLKQSLHSRSGVQVVDIPIGTGRFLNLYKENNCTVVGIDRSQDMLAEAREKAENLRFPVDLRVGDITNINEPNRSCDIAVCIRVLNLMNQRKMTRSIHELSRISSSYIITGITTYIPIRTLRAVFPGHNLISILMRRLRRMLSMQVGKLKGVYHFVHKAHEVDEVFQAAGLEIHAKKNVEVLLDGTSYDIFLLKKRKTASQ